MNNTARRWPYFVFGGGLIVLVCVLYVPFLWREQERLNTPAIERVILIASVVALLAALVVLVAALWQRQQLFHRVAEIARGLSNGELVRTPANDPADTDALSAALRILRQRMAEQLQIIDRQRSMLASLVNQLREGVIVADSEGRIALVNPTAVRLLNLSTGAGGTESLVGRSVEACVPQHALQRMLTHEADGVAADSEEQDSGGLRDIRLEVQTPGGTTHLLARGSDLMLAEPERGAAPVGRVIVLLDITELQRTVQMRTDFVANASHELRTPLSTIRAAVETMLTMDFVTEGPAARQFLTKVDRQSARLEQMVKDLLDLSRIESPTDRFVPERIEVRRLFQDLHARFADALERKGLTWTTRVEPSDRVTVCVNPHLLRLILDNLLDNSIKFTEIGGITVGLTFENGTVTFEVRDTGCGIPGEDQQRVFERFYQVLRSRSGGPERGTGLGLSIVRHAVGAMRGQVRLESELGRGTRVLVTMPEPDEES